jgi:hypothetical protein
LYEQALIQRGAGFEAGEPGHTNSSLPTAYCLLPTACCLLPTAYCLLPTAYCLLPTAYCLLPTAYIARPSRNLGCAMGQFIPIVNIVSRCAPAATTLGARLGGRYAKWSMINDKAQDIAGRSRLREPPRHITRRHRSTEIVPVLTHVPIIHPSFSKYQHSQEIGRNPRIATGCIE